MRGRARYADEVAEACRLAAEADRVNMDRGRTVALGPAAAFSIVLEALPEPMMQIPIQISVQPLARGADVSPILAVRPEGALPRWRPLHAPSAPLPTALSSRRPDRRILRGHASMRRIAVFPRWGR